MQKTKIEWADYTWNPIKGICPVGCWYCYGRKIYQRFKLNPKMDFELHNPTAVDRLHRKNVPNGSKVFVCSTFELFQPKIPKSWRRDIFSVIKCNPKINFQILTKFPQNIDRPMPDNVWLGCTITGDDDQWSKGFNLYLQKSKVKFISFEPLFQPIEIIDELWLFDWIIMGRLTGHGNKQQPERAWIQEIVDECKASGLPVFLKNNLREIWGEPLIQELPDVAIRKRISTKYKFIGGKGNELSK